MSSSLSKSAVDPQDSDILAGRGKATYTHPGNKRYLQLINENIERYINETTKVGKTAIVRSVVQILQNEQRRFLQRDSKSDTWYELSRRGVLDKVGHSLRDMKQTKVSAEKKLDKKLIADCGPEGATMDHLPVSHTSLGFTSRLDPSSRMPYFTAGQLGLGGMMAQQYPTPAPTLLRQHSAAMGPFSGSSKLEAILETTNLILKERAAMNRAMQMGGAMQHHQQMMNSAMHIGMFGNNGNLGMGIRNPNFGHSAMLEDQQQHHAALQQLVFQQARKNQQGNLM